MVVDKPDSNTDPKDDLQDSQSRSSSHTSKRAYHLPLSTDSCGLAQ